MNIRSCIVNNVFIIYNYICIIFKLYYGLYLSTHMSIDINKNILNNETNKVLLDIYIVSIFKLLGF